MRGHKGNGSTLASHLDEAAQTVPASAGNSDGIQSAMDTSAALAAVSDFAFGDSTGEVFAPVVMASVREEGMPHSHLEVDASYPTSLAC